ncbi:sugar ABC transporter permease [Oceanobacillus piezotolerans]|uniref:Sugar ABC transporter permease n=1 Tax=Oceanobacillus piezotolerans TaxID=2448030 RepID=A0A498DDU6_9BACI|nr:sugar ABC transporter permease [Oceanobacillus piezotolerans]RLL41147.1 sugar ABC transporter permease [Oceanobacillus piezotolerans]
MKVHKSLYLFLIPGFFLYFTFFIVPTLGAFFYSITDWDGVNQQFNFVGLFNYTSLLTDDTVFITSINNNLKFLLFVVFFQTLLSLIFALILMKNTKTNIFYRALFFFPTILSSVSVAFIWSFIYAPDLGLLNPLLQSIGLGMLTQSWLGNPDIAIFSIAFVQVWFHTGQVMVIFIAGLQNVPKELYEAAIVDGANKWQRFTKITWPLIAPATTIVVGYTTIQSFKAFDLIFAMTGGGPAYSTEILATFIYNSAFSNYQFGYASAASVVLMVIVAGLTLVQFRLVNRNKVEY